MLLGCTLITCVFDARGSNSVVIGASKIGIARPITVKSTVDCALLLKLDLLFLQALLQDFTEVRESLSFASEVRKLFLVLDDFSFFFLLVLFSFARVSSCDDEHSRSFALVHEENKVPMLKPFAYKIF